MVDLFISYAREDTETARMIAERAKEFGFTVWWDRKMAAGADLHAVIEGQIRGAKRVIVIWSKNSVKSRWVRDEAELATRDDKLIPICIDDSEPPIGFRVYNVYHINQWDTDFKRILGALSPRVQYFTATHLAASINADHGQINDLLKGLRPETIAATTKFLEREPRGKTRRSSAMRTIAATPTLFGGMKRAAPAVHTGRAPNMTHLGSSGFSSQGGHRPAEIGTRALAFLIDVLVIAIGFALLSAAMRFNTDNPGYFYAIVLWIAYHLLAAQVLGHGRTLGFIATRLKLVDAQTGADVPVPRLIIFCVLRLVPISFVWHFFGGDGRMLHDRLSDVRVVSC